MFCAPTKGLWSFGDLETATWSEAEAVEGLSYTTRLELGFRLLVRTCNDCLLSTDPLFNSEFSTVSTFNPGLGSKYRPRACPAGVTGLSPGFQPWESS
jgi:hypothetical protein